MTEVPVPEFRGITRLEVITPLGREFAKRFDDSMKIKFSIQDDGKTLKIFVKAEI